MTRLPPSLFLFAPASLAASLATACALLACSSSTPDGAKPDASIPDSGSNAPNADASCVNGAACPTGDSCCAPTVGAPAAVCVPGACPPQLEPCRTNADCGDGGSCFPETCDAGTGTGVAVQRCAADTTGTCVPAVPGPGSGY